ncbi:MAG: EamA family transporter, partial [Bacillus amyloliquefaciens]
QSLGIVLIFAGMALSLIRKQKAVPAETQADSTRI